MAITIPTDMVIYNDELITSLVDTEQQETEVFNAGSNGAINIVPEASVGQFRQRAMFTNSVHIKRRDPNSTQAQVPSNLPMGEMVSAKLHKTYDVESTYSAFAMNGLDMGSFTSYSGQQVASEKVASHLNTGLMVARASLESTAAQSMYTHATALDHQAINKGLALMGDKSRRVVALVMHSAHWHGMMDKVINADVTDVAGASIITGAFPAFNRAIIVTDSPALDAGGGDYVCLGLVEGAVNIIETEEDRILTEPVGGLENLVYRIQGEYAINAEAKGMAYTKASGANPDDATLAVAANYTRIVGDVKSGPGMAIVAKAA